jgi:outer membrane immunogenic protein
MGAGLIAFAGAADAADIYQPPPPTDGGYYTPAPAFTWTGPYLGLQGGYGWGKSLTDSATNTVSTKGWQGGVYGGYNFQTASPIVVGVEADINASGEKGTNVGTTVSSPWNGAVRGRVGFAADRFLIYGAGGFAFGGVKVTDGVDTDTATRTGWTAGAGVEAAVTDNVVARLEYRYTNLGTTTLPNFGSTSYTSSKVLAGVGFKF